jgi:hypothetical protein
VNSDALPAPGSLEMGHAAHAVGYPPLPPVEVILVTVIQQRHGGRAPDPDRSSCEDHDPHARYWVFRVASWFGVASSMVLTLSLLLRMAATSRHVWWSFAVAYASLLLTFVASETKTHLSLDIILCLVVLFASWLITSVREENCACIMKVLCCSSRDN